MAYYARFILLGSIRARRGWRARDVKGTLPWILGQGLTKIGFDDPPEDRRADF